MATQRVEDERLLSALDTIERETAAIGVATEQGAFVELPAIDPSKLCPAYRNLRPALEVVVTVVAAVPIWGAKAAMGIRFAMQVADLACPADRSDALGQPRPT